MHTPYEIELAERNAPRMSHMSDAEIRKGIAALKALLPMYRDSFKNATAAGYQEDLDVYRAELLRRACVAFGVPMLSNLQMIGIDQAMRDVTITSTYVGVTELCQGLCDLGLMTGRPGLFVLTSKAYDLMEAAEDEAVNLRDAVALGINGMAALAIVAITNSYADTLRPASGEAMEYGSAAE